MRLHLSDETLLKKLKPPPERGDMPLNKALEAEGVKKASIYHSCCLVSTQ